VIASYAKVAAVRAIPGVVMGLLGLPLWAALAWGAIAALPFIPGSGLFPKAALAIGCANAVAFEIALHLTH